MTVDRIDPVLVEKVGLAIRKVLDPPVGDLDPAIPQDELEAAAEATLRVVFDELGLKEHADVHACEDCNRPTSETIGSYWLASDELWREVVGDDSIVLCPKCFYRRAQEHGLSISWRAVLMDRDWRPIEQGDAK